MNYTMSFQERAKLGMEQLSNQSPVTLTMACKQAQSLKTKSTSKNKKQRN
nr:hypothetical protein [Flavobacterium sp.]